MTIESREYAIQRAVDRCERHNNKRMVDNQSYGNRRTEGGYSVLDVTFQGGVIGTVRPHPLAPARTLELR